MWRWSALGFRTVLSISNPDFSRADGRKEYPKLRNHKSPKFPCLKFHTCKEQTNSSSAWLMRYIFFKIGDYREVGAQNWQSCRISPLSIQSGKLRWICGGSKNLSAGMLVSSYWIDACDHAVSRVSSTKLRQSLSCLIPHPCPSYFVSADLFTFSV